MIFNRLYRIFVTQYIYKMKKILLIALCATLSTTVFGQRRVDWLVDQLITPTSLMTNANSTTNVTIHAVLKNNGPDSVIMGDSIYIQWYILAGNTIVISFPSNPTQIAFYKTASKTLLTGDTVHYRGSFIVPLYTVNSGNFGFYMNSEIRRLTLAEQLPSNNGKLVPFIWFNRHGNGVSVENIDLAKLNVSPNPTNGVINFTLPVSNATENNVSAKIYDMSGKLVRETISTLQDINSLDLSTLNNGIYFVNITNGTLNYETKVTIIK